MVIGGDPAGDLGGEPGERGRMEAGDYGVGGDTAAGGG